MIVDHRYPLADVLTTDAHEEQKPVKAGVFWKESLENNALVATAAQASQTHGSNLDYNRPMHQLLMSRLIILSSTF